MQGEIPIFFHGIFKIPVLAMKAPDSHEPEANKYSINNIKNNLLAL